MLYTYKLGTICLANSTVIPWFTRLPRGNPKIYNFDFDVASAVRRAMDGVLIQCEKYPLVDRHEAMAYFRKVLKRSLGFPFKGSF